MMLRILSGTMVLGSAQGLLFLLQTVLISHHLYSDVLILAKGVGLYSLAFFIFDGNSGLVFSIGRKTFPDHRLYAGFMQYRRYVLASLLLIDIVFASAREWDYVFQISTTTLCCGLRSVGIDGWLDKRGAHQWAVAISNAWIFCLCAAAFVMQRVDDNIVAGAALSGSLLYYVAWKIISPSYADRPILERLLARDGEAFSFVLNFMGLYGIGQIYGRFSIFALGSFFVGPLAALSVYAKQVFNVIGTVVSLVRRLEVSGPSRIDDQKSKFTIEAVSVSLLVQGAAFLALSFPVAYAAHQSSVGLAALGTILLWQAAEKLSSNANYIFQLIGLFREAYVGTMLIAIAGLLGVGVAWYWNSITFLMYTESGAFLVYVSYAIFRYLQINRIANEHL